MALRASSDPIPAQARLRVHGVVQGVGFRPHVWRLATGLGLRGWVRNDAAGVEILLQGGPAELDAFAQALREQAPPLARIDGVDGHREPVNALLSGFIIRESATGRAQTTIGTDSAVCPACLAEMFDPGARRWRYAFTNCTHCGPRYTISRGMPYDRGRTSMAEFPLCRDCAAEYRDPADRRFHAEPVACPACGPTLEWIDPDAANAAVDDEIGAALAALRAGRIVAIKGLGGFHLAFDARNAEAVARLRARKHRESRPLALMALNPASLAGLVEMDPDARARLESRERPIVLLPRAPASANLLPGIADGLAHLGVMLPYAPLHYLLFHDDAGRPAGTAWLQRPSDLLLVMTSANPGGEPLVAGNAEALERLHGIAEAWLVHDRDIVVRCDDSVVACAPPRVVRRARGAAPGGIPIPGPGADVLALGGLLKNTFCLTRGGEAFVSQHIGTLDNVATIEVLEESLEHMQSILDVRPRAVAHDLHPDFPSTRLAQALADRWDVPALPVQHHHAHIAAVATEHGHGGPLLGLALDGSGLGNDGHAWGGELLLVHGARFRRLGHLRMLPLPGGDLAAREPWRMAAAVLHAMGRGDAIAQRFSGQPQAVALARWLGQSEVSRGARARLPLTTALGRWFDAAAAMLGLCPVQDHEAQAAMRLEALAIGHGPAPPWSDGWRLDEGCLDLLPLMARLAEARDVALAAARFHATVSHALADWTLAAVREQGLGTVALGGGCLLNSILASALSAQLRARGCEVFLAERLPPGDGGISLGQACIARQWLHGHGEKDQCV